jgi:hypothetical protein
MKAIAHESYPSETTYIHGKLVKVLCLQVVADFGSLSATIQWCLYTLV